jgi:hypothetical protein
MPSLVPSAKPVKLRQYCRGFFPGLASVFAMAGCASVPDGASAGAAVPPPRAAVTRHNAWRDAESMAALDPARLTVIGAGDSMRPIYGENTVLVLQKIPYAALEPGMNVAYRSDRGGLVLHRLIALDAGGWRAGGLNNETEDKGRVTPHNLVGIVYAAFSNDEVE